MARKDRVILKKRWASFQHHENQSDMRIYSAYSEYAYASMYDFKRLGGSCRSLFFPAFMDPCDDIYFSQALSLRSGHARNDKASELSILYICATARYFSMNTNCSGGTVILIR